MKPAEHFAVESCLDGNERIAQGWREAYGEGVEPGLAATRDER